VTAPHATVAPPPAEAGRLNRPGRAVIALAELVCAGFAVWGAFWAWPRGFATITTVISNGTELDSQRISGNWLAAAIGFGTLAGVLVLDSLRQLLLAVRAKPKRARRRTAPEPMAVTGSESAGLDAGPEAGAEDAKVTGDD
jgi:hypothetical protein